MASRDELDAAVFSIARRKRDPQGDLVIRLGDSEYRQKKPVAYQEVGGTRIEIVATWRLHGREAGFGLGSYDHTKPLVVDPALYYSTYLGGNASDNANALESYLKWAEQFKLPMWLTEWGCLNQSDPTAATVKTFYDDAIVMFKKHPLLERYGWFLSRAGDNNALISSSTVMLTPLGGDYAAAPSTR